MMRTARLFALLTFIAALAPSLAYAAAEDAFGVWNSADTGSNVKFYSCGEGLCAQIVKTNDPNARDVKNPDASKRDRKVEGLIIMENAKKTGENQWKGNLYNREDGGTYKGIITVINKNQVKLEGCGLGGLICKGVTWSRVNE